MAKKFLTNFLTKTNANTFDFGCILLQNPEKFRRASRAGFCFVFHLNSLKKSRRASRASFCFVILLRCPEKSPARFARRIRGMLEFEKKFVFWSSEYFLKHFLKNFSRNFSTKKFSSLGQNTFVKVRFSNAFPQTCFHITRFKKTRFESPFSLTRLQK